MTTDQVDLIRRTLAVKATDTELELFIGLANRTGLDPFVKQIYLVPRKQNVDGKWIETHQTMVSIDGARLVAQRSGKYRGQLAPEWCGEDGKWRDVWTSHDPPAAARVAVIHADYPDTPTWGVARYGAYVQLKQGDIPTATWHRMPDVMLAKCAEMLALRKAFQQDLSGLIIEEEAGNDPVVLEAGTPIATQSDQPMPPMLITREERNALDTARKKAGLTVSEVKAILERVAHVTNSQQLKSDQLEAVLEAIEAAGLDDLGAVVEEAEVVPDMETLL